MRYVKCLFCDNRKAPNDFLCAFCRNMYNPYVLEEWFSEFVKLEQIQKRITIAESANYDVDFISKDYKSYFGASRPRGRPKTTPLIESFIQSIYTENQSIRKITKACNLAGLSVSRESVRAIINRIKLTKNY